MGSGSFLVAALRYLVEALHRSLEHHSRIQAKGDRETVITLPFGAPATGEEREEVLDLPPEDDRFTERYVPLARHVVERCLYGVDLNPMAVELARLALWVETLDRELPFEYLDHKLKVGNSLVGCWVHLVDDYPIKALDRDDADGKAGERTKWLRQAFKDAKAELPAVIDAIGGASRLFGEINEPVGDLVAPGSRAVRGPCTSYPAASASTPTGSCSRATSTAHSSTAWTFGAPCGSGPLVAPTRRCRRRWRHLTPEQDAVVDEIAARQRFFHWEVEFPDVFSRAARRVRRRPRKPAVGDRQAELA